MTTPYLVIAGPTGSGKTALALAVAERLGGEIISCDSVQVYQGFDLASAKATPAERARVPHHLLDVVAGQENFDAARYVAGAQAVMTQLLAAGKLPVICGGTGLYLRALLGRGWNQDLPSDPLLKAELEKQETASLYTRLQKLDPVRASEIHANDRFRVVRSLELVTLLGKPLREAGMSASKERDAAAFIVVLEPDRAELHARIASRTRAMLAAGLLDEVRQLLAQGLTADAKPMQSIGYKQAAAVLAGELPEAELEMKIIAATRQYAKRQSTWFRGVDADLRLTSADVDRVVLAFQQRC